MAALQEYKCPCCGGAIEFDSGTQKMKCPYCDTEFDVETLVGYDEELKCQVPDDMKWKTDGDGSLIPRRLRGFGVMFVSLAAGRLSGMRMPALLLVRSAGIRWLSWIRLRGR